MKDMSPLSDTAFLHLHLQQRWHVLLVLAGILVLADVTTLSLLLVLAGIQMLLRHSETLPQTLVRESDAWFRSLMLDRCFVIL